MPAPALSKAQIANAAAAARAHGVTVELVAPNGVTVRILAPGTETPLPSTGEGNTCDGAFGAASR